MEPTPQEATHYNEIKNRPLSQLSAEQAQLIQRMRRKPKSPWLYQRLTPEQFATMTWSTFGKWAKARLANDQGRTYVEGPYDNVEYGRLPESFEDRPIGMLLDYLYSLQNKHWFLDKIRRNRPVAWCSTCGKMVDGKHNCLPTKFNIRLPKGKTGKIAVQIDRNDVRLRGIPDNSQQRVMDTFHEWIDKWFLQQQTREEVEKYHREKRRREKEEADHRSKAFQIRMRTPLLPLLTPTPVISQNPVLVEGVVDTQVRKEGDEDFPMEGEKITPQRRLSVAAKSPAAGKTSAGITVITLDSDDETLMPTMGDFQL